MFKFDCGRVGRAVSTREWAIVSDSKLRGVGVGSPCGEGGVLHHICAMTKRRRVTGTVIR